MYRKSYYDTTGSGRVYYSEGLFLGYRYYDSKNVETLFPFGFGLSYTTFGYSNLNISPENMDKMGKVTVDFDVSNTGKVVVISCPDLYSSGYL